MTWPKVKLGEVIIANYGKALKAENRDDAGEHDVFGSSGYVGKHSATLTGEPTIIIGRKGSVGAVTFAPCGGWTIDTAYYVTLKQNADWRFLFYSLKNARLEDLAITTSIPGLNRESLYRVEIPLPPLAEQKRIAAILDQADALRRVRRESLARLDELAQSLFLEMFGDPATNPKGWDVVRLQDVCEKIVDCPHSTPKWTAEGVTCVRTSNLLKGGWDWTDHRFVSEEEYAERIRRAAIRAGDIILSREGTIGIAAIVLPTMRICMGQRLVQLRPLSNKTSSPFLLFLLLDELSPERISNSMAGSTSKHLNVGDLRRLAVPLPPLTLQQSFAAQIEELEAIKARARASQLELDALFASLQARAFAGEL